MKPSRFSIPAVLLSIDVDGAAAGAGAAAGFCAVDEVQPAADASRMSENVEARFIVFVFEVGRLSHA
jgi:hypothetical protein